MLSIGMSSGLLDEFWSGLLEEQFAAFSAKHQHDQKNGGYGKPRARFAPVRVSPRPVSWPCDDLIDKIAGQRSPCASRCDANSYLSD
jgi:hypothetical protein